MQRRRIKKREEKEGVYYATREESKRFKRLQYNYKKKNGGFVKKRLEKNFWKKIWDKKLEKNVRKKCWRKIWKKNFGRKLLEKSVEIFFF